MRVLRVELTVRFDRWFSVTMGTGMVGLILHVLPYNGVWIFWLSVLFFCLNIIFFVLILLVSIVRLIIFPHVWSFIIRHPVFSLFVGTMPIGLATLIDLFLGICVPVWGGWALTFIWVVWWVDAALSIASCFCLPFILSVLAINEFDVGKID
jgi:tellurite resistance protein TehA-like permease